MQYLRTQWYTLSYIDSYFDSYPSYTFAQAKRLSILNPIHICTGEETSPYKIPDADFESFKRAAAKITAHHKRHSGGEAEEEEEIKLY